MECFKLCGRFWSIVIVILLGIGFLLSSQQIVRIDPLWNLRPPLWTSGASHAGDAAVKRNRYGAGQKKTHTIVLKAPTAAAPEGVCKVLQQLVNDSCEDDSCAVHADCDNSSVGLETSDFLASPPESTDVVSEARLVFASAASSSRFVLFLRDPRDVVVSACQHPGQYGTSCDNLNLFLVQQIRAISRWTDLRYRIFTEMQQQHPKKVSVFFYDDFRQNATDSLNSLRQFMRLSSLELDLQSLASEVAKPSICLAGAVLPGYFAASLARIMKQELSQELADRWLNLCPPTWPMGCPPGARLNRGTSPLMGDTCGSKVHRCPDLCHRMAVPPFCASMASGLMPKPCRTDKAGLDWMDRMVPNTESRGVMHTYFQPISSSGGSEAYPTLAAWRYAWERAGWTIRILNLSHAQQMPEFEEFNHTLWTKVPLGQGYEYDFQCYIRYLAMAAVGGGWMSDYDVIPTYLPPDVELPNRGTFTVYQQHVPALMSGSKEQWQKVARRLLEKGVKNGSPGHLRDRLFSDMHSMEALTSEKSREFIFMNVVGSAETWKPLPKTRCDVLKSQISLAMHFSHAALDQAGVHIMRRGEIMTKAADRWWTCHGLGTSLLTTTSTTTTRSTTNASSSVAQPSAAADWRFGAGGNATFHLLSSIATESDGACAVLNQLGKLRCFSELNCSSDVTCGRDELYLENIQNTTGCKPSWPALPNQTQIMGEARLFLQTSGRFMVFLRDPRDLVIASFRAAGAAKNQDCPGMALFAMRHIQPVSRWVNWRHRIVSQIREIDDSLAAVFFFEDFVNNATSVVRSMARFMGVQVSASMLKSLSDVANSTNANSTNKGGGRRLCLSASVVPGHVGAAMTRLMQRELSTTLWDRWRSKCEPVWPKLPPCPGDTKLAIRTKTGGDRCVGPVGEACPTLCQPNPTSGCAEPGLTPSPLPCVVSRTPKLFGPGPPHKVPRGVMHTYFTSTDASDPEDRTTHTLSAWQQAWRRAGWATRVLTVEDAKTAANFSQFHHDLATKVPLGSNRMYDYHCYMRYLAMAEAGGGWMSDYDVIPTWFPPDTDLPNDGRFTSYQNHVPALLSGTQEEWYRMADTLLTLAVEKGKEKAIELGNGNYLFSDMFALLELRSWKPQPLHFVNYVGDGEDWGPKVKSTDCATMRKFTVAMHISHRAMDRLGLHINFRGVTMTKASERFWQCDAESQRGFAAKLSNETSTTSTTSAVRHRLRFKIPWKNSTTTTTAMVTAPAANESRTMT